MRGIAALDELLPKLLAALPVERFKIDSYLNSTEAHIQGTTVMGDDPADSVIDRNMVHHRVRNLLVMGSGAFPTGAPANPTLTISALALRAAAHQYGQGSQRA
jgi:choline dehydrogenase-like flavoprotein